MIVELRSLDTVKPYPGNPRVNDTAVQAVANSIRAFGFRSAIVVDEHDVILAGHTRYLAATKLGLGMVPVHVAAGLSPEQARAYRIADNQTANLSTWDDDKLVAELMGLQAAGVDLDLTGFTAGDLARLLEAPATEPLADPDAVPDAPAEPETKPGDLWVLGDHRLLCGDATYTADLARLMGDATADLLLTDPPYGVGYTGKTAEALTIANDDVEDDDAYRAFLAAALRAALHHVRPGGGFYVWHADVHGLPVRLAVQDAGLTVRQCLIWAKNAFVLGRQDFQWQHEPCLYGWKDGAAHTWLGDRSQSTLLAFDRPARNADHPTPKPVEMIRSLMRNSCKRGGGVLDVFGGSGTTLIAAEQEGRRAFLTELDPAYVDVIRARWEAVTGRPADRRAGV
ncbi:MAG TPA: DNA modification methylase [Gemmataceae bacterium]|nr:DNA modification methylase [Gemmataceae bacterium]